MNQLIEQNSETRENLGNENSLTFFSGQWRAGRRLSKVIVLLLKLISTGKIVLLILTGGGRHVEVLIIILIFIILHFCLSGSCPIRGSTFVRVPFNG